MSSILRLWEKKGYPPALAHYGTVELDSLWLDSPVVFLLVSCAKRLVLDSIRAEELLGS